MRVKTVIKRIIIGIGIFLVAMWVFGFILLKTGYRPPAKTEQPQSFTEVPEEQAIEPQVPQPTLAEVPQQVTYELIDPAQTDIDEHDIIYMIVSKDPAHIGVIKRFALRVVIYQRLTKAQLMRLAEALYREAQKVTPFNALGIYFYDYPQFIDDGTRLGFVQYVPNGRWADAETVQTGDYSTMKVIDHLFEPDWTNAFSEQEANICNDFFELEHKYQEASSTGNEAVQANERAQEEIARKYDIKKEDVYRLWMKFEAGYEKKP
jgi:hypothetical protein